MKPLSTFAFNFNLRQYITCVYWAITTMTTIGYGDIVPSNTEVGNPKPQTLNPKTLPNSARHVFHLSLNHRTLVPRLYCVLPVVSRITGSKL